MCPTPALQRVKATSSSTSTASSCGGRRKTLCTRRWATCARARSTQHAGRRPPALASRGGCVHGLARGVLGAPFPAFPGLDNARASLARVFHKPAEASCTRGHVAPVRSYAEYACLDAHVWRGAGARDRDWLAHQARDHQGVQGERLPDAGSCVDHPTPFWRMARRSPFWVLCFAARQPWGGVRVVATSTASSKRHLKRQRFWDIFCGRRATAGCASTRSGERTRSSPSTSSRRTRRPSVRPRGCIESGGARAALSVPRRLWLWPCLWLLGGPADTFCIDSTYRRAPYACA